MESLEKLERARQVSEVCQKVLLAHRTRNLNFYEYIDCLSDEEKEILSSVKDCARISKNLEILSEKEKNKVLNRINILLGTTSIPKEILESITALYYDYLDYKAAELHLYDDDVLTRIA